MNTKAILDMADHIISTTAEAIIADTDKKTVYQWQTIRGAVVMELLTEADARTWYDKYMKTPTGSFMAGLSLYKIEVTKLVTKL